jgi:hypothetical protein
MGSTEDCQDVLVEEPHLPKLTKEAFLAGDFATDSNPIHDIQWAFQARGVEGLSPEDAPSPGAWALLWQINNDEVFAKSFYSTVFPKLLPSKSAMEKDENRVDDGRKLFQLIEGLLLEPDDDAPVLSHTERRARELALSSESS